MKDALLKYELLSLCYWSLLCFVKLVLLLFPHRIFCIRYRTCLCQARFLLPHLDSFSSVNYIQPDWAVAFLSYRLGCLSLKQHISWKCNNLQFSQQVVSPHRKGPIPVPEFQWWKFYCLSKLHSSLRMGLSFTSIQLLYSTFWCTKPKTTRKCLAHSPDSHLVCSGKTHHSFTILCAARS